MWEPLFSPYSLGSVCYLPGPMRPKGTKLYLGLWDSQTQAWASSWAKGQDLPACFFLPEHLPVS